MGSYHGIDGFREFSDRKAVYTQISMQLPDPEVLRPPYGKAVEEFLNQTLGR